MCAALAPGASGQTRWAVVGGEAVRSVIAIEANAVADTLAERGHLLARVDSVRADTAFVTAGPVAVVGALDVVGAAALDPAAGWRTRPGEPFRPAAFRADLEATAARYAQTGRLAVRIVPAVAVADGGASVDVTVQVDEGPVSQIVGVELAGARGTGRAFASRRAGVTGPTDPAGLDRQRVRAALEATGLYESVGEPILALDDAGELVVQVPVVEGAPGVVDAVVGYLPPAGGTGGGVVGRGRVDVRSPFGGGRTAAVEVERTPGLASALAASLSDPFLFGTPFGVGLSFAGATRDSTLSRQRFGAEVRYALDRGLDVVATVASEAVRPGRFGSSEVDGRPRVRRTDDVLVGLGLDLRRLDRPRNPRRGAALFVVVEQGRRAGDALDGARGRRRLGVESRVFLGTSPPLGTAPGTPSVPYAEPIGSSRLNPAPPPVTRRPARPARPALGQLPRRCYRVLDAGRVVTRCEVIR